MEPYCIKILYNYSIDRYEIMKNVRNITFDTDTFSIINTGFNIILVYSIIPQFHNSIQDINKQNAMPVVLRIALYPLYLLRKQQYLSIYNMNLQKVPISSDFIFCYDQESPTSIVMLSPHDRVLQNLLQNIKETYIFWIHNKEFNVNKVVKKMQSQVIKYSQTLANFEQLQKLIKQNTKYDRIIVVTSFENQDEVLKFLRKGKILGTILYDFGHKLTSHQKNAIQTKQDSPENRFIMKCFDLQSLKIALVFNNWRLYKPKQFSNFVSTKKKDRKSKVQLNLIAEMCNQKVDLQTRACILQELRKLSLSLSLHHPVFAGNFSSMSAAIDQLKYSKLTKKRIISLYTAEQYKFYALINIILRSTLDSTHCFYIQPFLKELMQSVKQVGQETDQPQMLFRGTETAIEQIQTILNSVGVVIQNLGFLSASESESVAFTFKKNTFITIIIPKKTSKTPNGFGLADISKQSSFSEEKEVLFNPLNYFKVLQLTQKTKKSMPQIAKERQQYMITLQFVEIYDELTEHKQKIDKFQLFIHNKLLQISTFQFSVIIVNISNKQQAKIHKIYWQNCLQIFKKFDQYQQYATALLKYSRVLNRMGAYKESLELVEQRLIVGRQIYEQDSIEQYNALLQMSWCLISLDRFNQSQQLATDIIDRLSRSQSTSEKKQILYKAIQIKSTAMFQTHKSIDVLNLYNKHQTNMKQCLGEYHPVYCDFINTNINNLCKIVDYQITINLCQQHYKSTRQIFGQTNIITMLALDTFANILKKSNNIIQEVQIRQKCVRIYKQCFGLEYPNTKLAVIELANSYYELHLYSKSLTLLEQSFPTYNFCNKDHDKTILLAEIYLKNYWFLKRYEKSLKIHRKFISSLKQKSKDGANIDIYYQARINYVLSLISLGQMELSIKQLCGILYFIGVPDIFVKILHICRRYGSAVHHIEAVRIQNMLSVNPLLLQEFQHEKRLLILAKQEQSRRLKTRRTCVNFI